jgi:predicted transcriptional regulator
VNVVRALPVLLFSGITALRKQKILLLRINAIKRSSVLLNTKRKKIWKKKNTHFDVSLCD